ncbi:hypothetical protein E4T49_06628 [Aureobasidium sp. EXF-10728]|nr:hypothetical protein E4T49_06628 [Aureobasidium sp. EXF-10728]
MADPRATMTFTIDVPQLAQLVQTVRDLTVGIRELRQEFSVRLAALEAESASRKTNQSQSRTHENDDLQLQTDDLAREDLDHEVNVGPRINPTYEDTLAPRDDAAHEDSHVNIDKLDIDRAASRFSTPSIDQGFTATTLPPAAAAGRKRKRTSAFHIGEPDCINRSGFVFRDSDAQLAGKKIKDASGTSRSESPFDVNNNNNDRQQLSSDDLEIMPPVRPRLDPSPLPQHRVRALHTVEAQPEEITMSQRGRVRKQTQRPDGFVSTPKEGEINKMSRQTRLKK